MSMLFKRIKDWATSIADFRAGDVIPVDGPSGTAKMSKNALLALVAQPDGTYPDMTAGNISNRAYSSGEYGSISNWCCCVKLGLKSVRGAVSIRCFLHRGSNSNYAGYVDIIVKSLADNSWTGVGYVTRNYDSGGEFGAIEYLQENNDIYICINAGAWNSYCVPMITGTTSAIDVTFGNYEQYVGSKSTTVLTVYVKTYSPINANVGSSSQPVYVDSDGRVQPCNIRFISVSGSWTAPSVSGDAKFTLYNDSGSSVSLVAGGLSKTLLEGEYCDLLAVNGTWEKFSNSYI